MKHRQILKHTYKANQCMDFEDIYYSMCYIMNNINITEIPANSIIWKRILSYRNRYHKVKKCREVRPDYLRFEELSKIVNLFK